MVCKERKYLQLDNHLPQEVICTFLFFGILDHPATSGDVSIFSWLSCRSTYLPTASPPQTVKVAFDLLKFLTEGHFLILVPVKDTTVKTLEELILNL